MSLAYANGASTSNHAKSTNGAFLVSSQPGYNRSAKRMGVKAFRLLDAVRNARTVYVCGHAGDINAR
jgi:hypothetical protein